uniref:Replication factor A C-terminal domain-containing protein n=1 Tax=Setaria viridis TaxID=4556 RepID=A0A4U6TEB8_SETVI|nr:hypothetical protein SEVIR_8G116000v2 [Setaria viridis]
MDGDDDGVGQVKLDVGKLSRRPGSWEQKTWRRRRLGGGRTRVDIGEPCLAGRASGFDRFGLKIGDESRLGGVQEDLTDVIAMIVGVSDVTHIRVGSNSVDTPSRVIGLKDLSEETLSSGSNWKWYLDEDIAEIDKFCERYRLCLICSDGTAAAKFVLFGRVAQQVVGKPVMSLMKSDGIPKEIAAIVSCFFVSFRVTIMSLVVTLFAAAP